LTSLNRHGRIAALSKRAVAELLGQLERQGLRTGAHGFVHHRPQLSEIVFETRSVNHDVTVHMNALGALEDVEFRNDVRSRIGPEALAHLITTTVRQADEIRRKATAEWQRRTAKEADRG